MDSGLETASKCTTKMEIVCGLSHENNKSMNKVSETVLNNCQEINIEVLNFMLDLREANEEMVQKKQMHSFTVTELVANNTADQTQVLLNSTCQELERAFAADQNTKTQEIQNQTIRIAACTLKIEIFSINGNTTINLAKRTTSILLELIILREQQPYYENFILTYYLSRIELDKIYRDSLLFFLTHSFITLWWSFSCKVKIPTGFSKTRVPAIPCSLKFKILQNG